MLHEERVQLVKRLFWDYKIDPEEAVTAMEIDSERIGNLHRNTLFIKLLNYYPWHLVREIVPEQLLPKLLSDEVINGLFPPELRERYKYVRRLL
jgi:hypothetical protein